MLSALVFALATAAPLQKGATIGTPIVTKTQINDTEFGSYNVVRRQKPFLPINKRDVREGRFSSHVVNRVKRVPPPSRTPHATPRATPVVPPTTPLHPPLPTIQNDFSFPTKLPNVEELARLRKEIEDKKKHDEEPEQQAPDVLEIVSVTPTTVSSKGGQIIEVQVRAEFMGVVFCRFGRHVTSGRHSASSATFTCVVPELPEGDVQFSVSRDRSSWSSEVTLHVVADESDLPWGVVAIGGVVVIGVCLLAAKMLFWKRRVPKRNSGDGLMSNVDPMEIRPRGPDRKANLHHRRGQENML